MVLPMAMASVQFTVIDKNGNPIKSASINVTYSNGTDIGCAGTTNSDGQISKCSLANNKNYNILVTDGKYQQIDDNSALHSYTSDWTAIAIVMRPETFSLNVHVCEGGSSSGCTSGSSDVENARITTVSLDPKLTSSDFDSAYDLVVFPGEDSSYAAFQVKSSESTQTTDANGVATVNDLEYDTKYNLTVTKSGYPTTWVEYDFPNKAEDTNVDIKLIEPGTAKFTAVVYNKANNNLISGATVVATSRATGKQQTEQTDSHGAAAFDVSTPDCYDITATKANYASDTAENQCFNNNDNLAALPLFLVSQNEPPVAKAGQDQYVMVGTSVTLDASASSDPNGDNLSYKWSDSLGAPIQDGVRPVVTFTAAGDHVITLTASDGSLTNTATTHVFVDSPQNCGNGICSPSENASKTCPQDCPVCMDHIRGAGENNPNSSAYCPVDYSISAAVKLLNTTAIVLGNATPIAVVDPMTGAPIIGAAMVVTLPNGSVIVPQTFMGKADVTFPVSGKYVINVTAAKYSKGSKTVELGGGWDLSWLLWLVIIIVVALVAIRLFNKIRINRGSKGYRAKNFRRRKPTLSSV